MRRAGPYRFVTVVIVFVWIVAISLYRFRNFSLDAPRRKWLFKEIIASSFSPNSPDFDHSNFQVHVEQANLTENAQPEALKWIHVLPGIVSLEPPRLARVVFGGATWLFECQSAGKETTVPPYRSQVDFCDANGIQDRNSRRKANHYRSFQPSASWILSQGYPDSLC